MAGIYVHIPFCRRACHYCDFHFTTNLSKADDLVQAILTEIGLRKDYLNGEPITTVYFGGGTPSLLPSSELAKILLQITEYHSVDSGAEITLEANPEDLSEEKLGELKSLGINRLSLGTQSFIDSELKWMNRMHSAEQATSSIRTAQKIGFKNISIDLIFGLPGQTHDDWKHNLNTAVRLNVQHISSYSLTVEPKTVLHSRIQKGMQQPPDDEAAVAFFNMNMDTLPANGFEHYEISNYAKKGFISRHNSAYWKGVPYIGLGPAAHSFNGISREWNVRSNAAYISAMQKGESFSTKEELSEKDRLNEHLLTRLRTKWGADRPTMEAIKVGSWQKVSEEAVRLYPNLVTIDSNTMKLTRAGFLMADKVTSDLFV